MKSLKVWVSVSVCVGGERKTGMPCQRGESECEGAYNDSGYHMSIHCSSLEYHPSAAQLPCRKGLCTQACVCYCLKPMCSPLTSCNVNHLHYTNIMSLK